MPDENISAAVQAWDDYFAIYIQDIGKIKSLNSFFCSEAIQNDSWLQIQKVKAHKQHAMYLQNNRYIYSKFQQQLQEPSSWEPETAASLLSFLFLRCTYFDDVEAAYILGVSLYQYYTVINYDEIAIMKCYMIFLTCYGFLDMNHFRPEICQLCNLAEKIYCEHYFELTDEEKSLGLSCYDYDNIVWTDLFPIDEYFSSSFDKELKPRFINRLSVIDRYLETADLDLKLNRILPFMRQKWIRHFLYLTVHLQKGNTDNKQLIFLKEITDHELQNAYEHNDGIENIVQLEVILLLLKNLQNKNTDQNSLQKLLDLEDKLSADGIWDKEKFKEVWSVDEFDDERFYAYILLARALNAVEAKEQARKEAVERLLDRLFYIISKLPSTNYFEHIVDMAAYNFMIPLLTYLNDEELIIRNLLQLTIYRQPQTCIHSVMVARLAACIMEELTTAKPELLLQLLNCSTIEDVEEHQGRFIAYIEKASLLHDIGKLLCSGVINMQYRKLTEPEFKAIRFHPETSREILDQIPQLADFTDIALGHHKSFDGKTGYPDSFDNTASPMKIFIDLISICDSLDAATDSLGRSYEKTKSFSEVLDEFIAGSGTRYSDVLVQMISENADLQNRLSDIVTLQREEVYREVRDQFRKKHGESCQNPFAADKTEKT